jgi:hypothetical protein
MQAHFNDALLIQRAVIAGTPERAAAPAAVLTSLEELERLPDGWRPYVERMQQLASRINDGTTAALVAAATADLGVSCGLCHRKHGGPEVSHEPAPTVGSSIEDRMRRHVWATERLWEALYVPSNEAWVVGAAALGNDPFPDDVLRAGGVHGRSAAGDFASIAARAPAQRSTSERATLYAELLVTCGACHRSLQQDE